MTVSRTIALGFLAVITAGALLLDLLQKYKAPHPNPPLSKGREQDYSCFPP